jgi:hypothetical protein
MSDKIELDLEENSKYRVAFDLASRIANNESKLTTGDRDYWLKLYLEARSVVFHGRQ